MINSISYYTLLFIIIIFYCLILANNIKKSPKKIKLVFTLLLITAILKNIVIAVVGFLHNPNWIKILQVLSFSDLFYVPAILLVIFYVFWRNNNFNFNIIISSVITLTILGIAFISRLNGKFIVFLEYGYVININKDILSLIFVAIIGLLLVMFLLSKKYIRTNNKGILGITIVSVSFIVEYLTFFAEVNIYPYALISELFLIGLITYGMESGFKN